MLKSILSVCVLMALVGCVGVFGPPASPPNVWTVGKIVDLTHPFDETTIYWPTAEPFHLKIETRGVSEAGFYYEANSFAAAEHGGTHLDAPSHFAKDHWRNDQIPLEKLMGAAVVVDVSRKALQDADYLIGVDDLREWESANGRLPQGVILLFRTGYSQFWPDAARYLGTDLRGVEGVAQLHFPGISPEAARWLVAQRRVSAVGIDTASIDFGQSKLFETHQTLFRANIPAFENVDLSNELPTSGFHVVALPMKIGGGSGGPLRIVALTP